MANGRSAFLYIGIGCLVVLLLGATCVGGCFIISARWAKQVQQTMESPNARTEKAREILGVEKLPEGYHAVAGLEVPFLAKIVVLSNAEPKGKEGIPDLGDSGLIYVDFIRMGGNEKELRDYFEGRTDDPGVLRRNNINVDTSEIIGRGVIEAGGADLLYVAQRGSISTQGMSASGITAVCLVKCPNDHRARIAVWYTADPASGKQGEEIDLSGTPADEASLAAFMEQFRFCGRSGS